MPRIKSVCALERDCSTSALGLIERIPRTLYQRIFANTPELIREAHSLRYQVYCVERQFEDPEQNPEGLERDRFDRHSLHAMLRHRISGTPVATARWILHEPDKGPRSFPVYEVCSDPLIRSHELPLEKTAELSRFAISKKLRRRAAEPAHRGFSYRESERNRDRQADTSNIALHLMAAALQIAFVHGLEYGLGAMEPKLIRLLRRFGLKFEPLGPLVHYHGWRQPCFAHIPTLMNLVKRDRPEIWDFLTENGRFWSSSHVRDTAPEISVTAAPSGRYRASDHRVREEVDSREGADTTSLRAWA